MNKVFLTAAVSAVFVLSACGGSDNNDDASSNPGETPAGTVVSSFVLPVLPDTQFYARYNGDIFTSQTRWLAKNQAALSAPIVLHVGDVVDQVNQQVQWVRADAAMSVLEQAKIPYAVVAGNHDVRNSNNWSDNRDAAEPYTRWFDKSRLRAQSTFGGVDDTGLNAYHFFEAQGQRYLVMALSWRAANPTLDWAADVLRNHPTLPTIVLTHQLINVVDGKAGDPGGVEGESAQLLWDKVISPNNQVFMTLNGHYHGAAHRIKKNAAGLDVLQVLVDYQMATDGGNGYMRLIELDPGRNTIRNFSFSPWVMDKPQADRSYIDELELNDPANAFTIAFDFKARFEAFNKAIVLPKQAGNVSLIDKTRDILAAAGYQRPADPRTPPAGAEDYAKSDLTLAHWRFVGGQAGTPVTANDVVADVTGNNPLRRGFPANSPLDAMVWSNSKHAFSAAPGSICMKSDKSVSLVNYLSTAADAPLNAQTFETGYTIEAFIQLGADFAEQKHGWMNVFAQSGMRRDHPQWRAPNEPHAPLAKIAVSNLKEFQWEMVPNNLADPSTGFYSRGILTNWSHEIGAGRSTPDVWQHVAIVNDGNDTTMYVEGVKVLRNTTQSKGIASIGKPWYVGAGVSNGNPAGGFNGCVGEIRVVGKPLAPNQWLSARAAR